LEVKEKAWMGGGGGGVGELTGEEEEGGKG